jgi:histidine triad (HIT) family protein
VDAERCLFCKIARGESPSTFVYEDEYVVAFDDISPQAPVHTLVIPRDHYEHLGEIASPQVLAALFGAVPVVARAKGVADSGYRVIVNAGPDASQSVPHLHVHVLGGKKMSHGMIVFKAE